MVDGQARVQGIVASGHRVASGLCDDPRFPAGTIAPQLPFFRAAIADLDGWLGGEPFPATINVALAGMAVRPGTPDRAIGPIRWTDHFPPERFLLSRCTVVHRGVDHPAWLYIPDPETKPDHHQPADRVEVLARRIDGLAYGDAVSLLYPMRALSLTPST